LVADENTANALSEPVWPANAYRRIPLRLPLLLLLLAIVAFESKIRFAACDEREMRFNPPDCWRWHASSDCDSCTSTCYDDDCNT